MNFETFLKIWSSPTKAKIIAYYFHCKCSNCDVCTVYKTLGIKQANMSKHLSDLLEYNILEFSKDGKERIYKINEKWYSEWKSYIDLFLSNKEIFISCKCKKNV